MALLLLIVVNQFVYSSIDLVNAILNVASMLWSRFLYLCLIAVRAEKLVSAKYVVANGSRSWIAFLLKFGYSFSNLIQNLTKSFWLPNCAWSSLSLESSANSSSSDGSKTLFSCARNGDPFLNFHDSKLGRDPAVAIRCYKVAGSIGFHYNFLLIRKVFIYYS